MTIKNILINSYYKLYLGIETPLDIILKVFFFVVSPFSNKRRWRLYSKYLENKLIKKHLNGGILRYKDIYLPDFTHNNKYVKGFISTYYDIIFFYDKKSDIYDSKLLNMYEKISGIEGTYCYQDDECDIVIKKGDVVIDAGAWIGSFSAYASKKGAYVYAFEPSIENRKYLEETSRLNGNIKVVPFVLSDKAGVVDFFENVIGSRIQTQGDGDNIIKNSHKVEAVTLDDFVRKNNIKIDFIKADIEGSERNLLLGATEVLRKYAPKLSICAYHLPDDKETLSKIITAINPKYKIIHRSKKLYAYV